MTCLKENTLVYIPIEEIIETKEDLIIFRLSSITIHTCRDHLFNVFEKGLCKAEKLKINDCLAVELSVLKPGDKVLSSEGLFKVKSVKSIRRQCEEGKNGFNSNSR